MALVNDTVLMANKALNRMESLYKQARSYYSNPTMVRARQVAGNLANSAWVKGRSYATSMPVMVGAGAGAAVGVGASMYNNPRGGIGDRVGAGIKGGLLGAGAGAGFKGFKDMGGRAGVRTRLGAYGSRMRGAFTNRVSRAQSEVMSARTGSAMAGGMYSS